MADLTRHPLPWHLPGQEKWVHLEPARWHDRIHNGDAAALSLGHINTTCAGLNGAELMALRDRIDEVLAAPFRLYVACGRALDPDSHGPALDAWLEEVYRSVDLLEVAHPGTNWAHDHIDTWCAERGVAVYGYAPRDFSAGGNAVALLPPTGREALHTAEAAHRAGIPAVHALPDLWPGRA